jgi:hypothetical protein
MNPTISKHGFCGGWSKLHITEAYFQNQTLFGIYEWFCKIGFPRFMLRPIFKLFNELRFKYFVLCSIWKAPRWKIDLFVSHNFYVCLEWIYKIREGLISWLA